MFAVELAKLRKLIYSLTFLAIGLLPLGSCSRGYNLQTYGGNGDGYGGFKDPSQRFAGSELKALFDEAIRTGKGLSTIGATTVCRNLNADTYVSLSTLDDGETIGIAYELVLDEVRPVFKIPMHSVTESAPFDIWFDFKSAGTNDPRTVDNSLEVEIHTTEQRPDGYASTVRASRNRGQYFGDLDWTCRTSLPFSPTVALVPVNVGLSSQDASSLRIVWQAPAKPAQGHTSIKGYNIYRDTTFVGFSLDLAQTDSALPPAPFEAHYVVRPVYEDDQEGPGSLPFLVRGQ